MFKAIKRFFNGPSLQDLIATNDWSVLENWLRKNQVYIAQRPTVFLELDKMDPEDLRKAIEDATSRLNDEPFEPWIIDYDGQMMLPAFTSESHLETFALQLSTELGKVFPLGHAQVSLPDVIADLQIDVIAFNQYSKEACSMNLEYVGRQ